MRVPPALPSASQASIEAEELAYDPLEDLATPTRAPEGGMQAPNVGPPMNLSTGPMQPWQPPPPSNPMPIAPPSSRGSALQPAAMQYAQPPQSQRQPMQQTYPQYQTPAPYPSQQYMPPAPEQHITGPQMPAMQRPNYNTGSYPTGVGGGPPSSTRTNVPQSDPGMPLGYVVASAFFLAIALVGFGLYLAFEVISL